VSQRAAHGIEPLHCLVPLAVACLLIFLSRGGIADIDLWWHRQIGEEIWRTGTVTGLGNDWAPFGDREWSTTQWLSEVASYWLHRWGQWELFPPVRVLAAAALFAALAFAITWRRPARAAVPVFVLTALAVMPALTQDRAQTAALLLCVPVSVWLVNSLSGRMPAWWKVAILSVLWANLHGSWILVPAVMLLISVTSVPAKDWEVARRGLILAVVSLVGALLNPLGPGLLVDLMRFSGRTGHLTEWQPTILADVASVPFAMIVVVLVSAWARSRSAVPWREILVAVCLAAFAQLAFRNLLFASILLAPLAAERLSGLTTPRFARGAEARALMLAAGVTSVLGLAAALVLSVQTDAVASASPTRIAAALARLDGPTRVLNDYNTAGVLVAFGGDGIELGIDGRADRYPAEYTDHYLAALATLRDWEKVVADVKPDRAVLETNSALSVHLRERGWTTVMTDGKYVLLEPPL